MPIINFVKLNILNDVFYRPVSASGSVILIF